MNKYSIFQKTRKGKFLKISKKFWACKFLTMEYPLDMRRNPDPPKFPVFKHLLGFTIKELQQRLGVKCYARVNEWANGRLRVTAEMAARIELVTKGSVKREYLRPDVFGPITKLKRTA